MDRLYINKNGQYIVKFEKSNVKCFCTIKNKKLYLCFKKGKNAFNVNVKLENCKSLLILFRGFFSKGNPFINILVTSLFCKNIIQEEFGKDELKITTNVLLAFSLLIENIKNSSIKRQVGLMEKFKLKFKRICRISIEKNIEIITLKFYLKYF